MNKLVSKNSVQRFKQGRKIVKAQYSWGKDFGSSWNNPYLVYDETQRANDEAIVQELAKEYGSPYLIEGSTRGGQQREADEALIQKMANEYWQQQANETQNLEKQPKQTTPKRTRVVRRLNTPKFYGQTIGGKVLTRGSNFGDRIKDSQKQALLNAGFKNEDFADVRSFQNALNNFFSKDYGAGSIKADNMWGNQTQKAFDLALSKAAALQSLGLPEIVKKPELPTISKNELPTINPKIRNGNYDRSQIRDLIRKGGFNPYAYTGAQRKALRLYLNGLSDDTSLLDGTDLARFTLAFRKKGGQLISRNPVQRFKLRTKI